MKNVPKGPFIATQLNSTSRSCIGEVSVATLKQLNSTQVLRPNDTTQLNWTLSMSSWVELRRYKQALTHSCQDTDDCVINK